MAPPNEHRWASCDTDELETHAPRRPSFPPALSSDELRELYRRNPTPEVRALLWEVARLHALVRRAAQLAACFPLYEREAVHPAFHIVLQALNRDLASEPYLAEAAKEGGEAASDNMRPGRRRR